MTTRVEELAARVREAERCRQAVESTPSGPPALVSRREAARRCGVCLESFDQHVRPSVVTRKVGRRVLVVVSSLEAWLAVGASRPASTAIAAVVQLDPERLQRAPAKATASYGLSPRGREVLERLRRRRAPGGNGRTP